MKSQEALRKRLINLLEEKGLAVNAVATKALVNPSTIFSILNGHSKKSEISTIAKICYGLGITVYDFFNDEIFKDLDEYEI